jgi:histidine ammonia-lyase
MLAQYTSASLVSENRGLCWPASSDSMSTSAGQEDHVSMGATSARRAAAILANSENAVAIELLAAAQGLNLREPLTPASGTGAALAALRDISPVLDEDRSLAPDIAAARELLSGGRLGSAVEDSIGPLG